MCLVPEIVPHRQINASIKMLLIPQVAELLAKNLGVFSVCLGWQYQISAADHDGAVFFGGRVAVNYKSVRFYSSHSFRCQIFLDNSFLTLHVFQFLPEKSVRHSNAAGLAGFAAALAVHQLAAASLKAKQQHP
jgi:hypothetical protein